MGQKQMSTPTHVAGMPVQATCPMCGRKDVQLHGLRPEDGGVGQRYERHYIPSTAKECEKGEKSFP